MNNNNNNNNTAQPKAIVFVDDKSKKRNGVNAQQVEIIKNIVEEEIQKIRTTLGFQHHVIVTVSFSKAQTRWGSMEVSRRTDSILEGTMSISKMTILAHQYGGKLTNTIMHELLHLMPNGHGHTGAWAEYANKINKTYGYNITRVSNGAEFNVPTELTQRKTQKDKYAIECPKCKRVWKYKRMSCAVQHPNDYACGKCRVPLVRCW